MDLAAPGNEVKVAIRVRPMLLKEQVAGMKSRWLCTDKMISPDSSQSSSTSYIFDRVFDESVSNKMVYDELASDIVKQAMIGFNGTVFTYGQSGSGKTYTIDALRTFAIKSAYDYIENSPAREFLMRVSYIELYNEKLTDLLSDGSTTLTIREDYDKNVYIDGLQEIIVKSQDHVKNVLAQGNARRTFAETKLNERSSRAHCIFRLVIESRERDDPEHSSVYASYLNLVDLAGSEKAGENSGERLREGVSINLSLLTLSQVIRKLSGEQREFINYRDSKLTRILQTALEGNSKTAILCTVAPFSVEETHSTLRFALNAKKVKTKPQQNEVLTDSAMLKKSQLEIRKLKNKIKELEERNLVQDNDELQRRRAEREVLIKEFSSFLCVSSKAREEKRGFEKKRRETVCVPQLYRSADFKVPGIPMDVPKLTFASAHPKQVESLSIPESPPANDSVFGVSHSLDSPCESQECSYCDLSFTGIEQAIVQESVLQKYTAKIKIYQREISDLNRKLRQRSGMFITSRRDIKKNKSFGSEILHPTFCEEDEEVFASAEEHIQSTNERLGEDVENMDALKAQNVLDQNEVEDLRSQLEALTVKMTQYDEKREESEKNMAELSDRIRRDEEEIKKLKAREEEMALQYEEENKRWKEKVEKLEWERSMQEMMKEEKGLLETTIIDKNEASERDLHEDLEMQKKELLNEWEEVSRLKEELNEQATSIENTLCTIEKDKEKLQKERGRIDREWNELEKSNDDLRKEKEEFDKKQESVESVTERVLAVQEAANPHLGSDGYSNAEMAHVLEKGTFVTSETEDVMSESHVFSPINGRYPENITLQEEKEALLRELDSLRQSVCELNARKCAFESEMANSEKLPKIEHDTDMARQDSSLQEEWKKLTKYQAELSAQEENVERKLDRLCMLEEEKEQFEEEKEQFYREKECLREAEMDLMVVKEAFKQEQSKVYQGLEQDREGNLVNRNQLSQEEERLQEQWEHLRKLQEQFHQEREAFKQEQSKVYQGLEQDREGNLVNRNQLSQEEERLQEQWEHLRKLQEQFHQEREAFKQEQLTVSQEREQDREGNLVNRNQLSQEEERLQEQWEHLRKLQEQFHQEREAFKQEQLTVSQEPEQDREGNKVNRSQLFKEEERLQEQWEHLRKLQEPFHQEREAFKQEQLPVSQEQEQDREGNLVNRNQLSQEEERLQEQWEHLRKLQEQFHQEREAFKQEQLTVSQEREQDREGNLVNRNQLSQEEERLQEQWEHLRKLQEQFHQEREAFKQEQLTVSQEPEQDREGNKVNRSQLLEEQERLQEQWEHLRKLQEQFHQEREAFKQEQLTVSQEPEQDREGNKVNRSQLSEEEERLQEQWEHLRKLQEQFNQEREAFKQEQLTVSQEREQDREGNLVNRNQLSQEEERLQEQWEHLRKLQEQFHQEREAFKQEQLTVSQEPEQDREGNKVNRSQLLEEEERLQEQWEHLRKLQEQFNQEREAFKQEQLTVSQEREQDREGNLVNRNQLSQEEERLQEQWEHLRKLQEQFHQEREAFKQEQLTVSQEPEQDREGNKVNRSQLLEEEERLQEQWEHLRKLQEQFHQERESFKQEQLTVSQEPEQDREGNKVNRSQLLEEQERLQEQWEHLRKLQEQFHQEREAFKQEQLTVSQEREQDREGNTVNRSQLLEEEERLQEQWEHLRKLQAQFHQEREAFKQEQLTVSQEPEQDREGNKVNRSQLFKEEERLQEQWEHLRKIQEPFHQEREAFKQEQLISQEPEQDREGNKVNRSQLLEEEERLQEQWEHLRKLQEQFHQEREAFKQEQSHVYQELEQDREGDMVNMNQLLKDEERLHKQWEPLRKLQEQFHQEKEAFEQARAEDQTRETLTRDQETLNSEWYILKQAQNDFRLEKEALEMSKVNVETNYLIGREDIGNVDRLKDKLSQVDDESGIVTATSWDNSSLCCEFKEGSKSMSVCIHEKVEQQWQEKKEESREQGENIRQLQEGMNVNILSETGGERVVQCLETCEESHSFEGKQTWQDVTDNMEQAEQVTKEHGLQYEEEKYTQKTLDQLQTLHDEMGKLQLEKEQLFNEKVILQAEKEQFQEVIDTLQRENKMLKVEKEDPQVDKESHLTARVAMVKTEQQDIDISVENMSLNAHHELRGDVLKDQDFETADLNEPDVLDETVRIQTGLSQSGCDISRYRQVSCHGEDSGEVCDLMTELKTAGFFIHEKKDRFDEEKGSLEGEWEQLKQAREELCSKEVALRDREEDIVQRSDILHKFNLQKEEEQLEMKKEALRIEEERLQKEKEMLEDMKAFLQEEADKLKTDKEVINEKAAVVQEEQARIQREQETLEKKKIDLEEHERLAKDFEERKAMHQKEQEIFQRKQETLEEQTAVLHEEQTILQQEKESFKERNLAFKEQQERLEREKQIIEQNIVLVHEQEARLHKEKGNLEKKIAAFQKEQDEFQIKAQIFEEKGAGLQEMQDRLHKEKEVFEYENMTLQSEKERFQKEKEICEEKNILFQEDQRRCQIEKETLQETIAGLQEQRVRCQKETEMFQEDQRRCQIEKETLQETIASLKEQQVRCQKETEMFQEEKEQLQEEKDRLQEEKDRLQEEKERLQEEKDRLQEEKDRLQEEKDRLHETIADLHAGYQKETEILKEGNDKLQEETIRLQKEKDRLHEESVRLHEESVRLQEENIRLQEAKVNFQKMHHEDETRRAAEELQKLEDNLDDAYDKIDRLESLITKGKAILAEKTEAVRQANDKVKELEEAVDALKSNLASLNSILEAKSNECEKLKKVQDSFRTAVREQEGLKKEMEDMVRGRTKDREYYDDTIRQLKLKLRDTQSAETSFLVQRNPPNQCAPTLDQMRKIVEFENAAKFLELKELKQRVQEHEAKITDLENEKLQLQTEIRRLQLLLDNETVKSEAMKSTANQKILAKRKVEEELAQLRKQLGKGDKQNTDETPDEMTKMLRNQLQEKDQLIEQLSESIDNRNRKWVAVSLRHKALIEENHTLQKLATEHQNKMADCAKLPPQGNVVRDSDDGMQKEKQSDVADLLKENSELKACLEKLKLEAHEQTPHKEDHVKQQQKQPSSSAESLHCVRGELSTPTESSHQPQQAQAFSVPSYRSGGGVESFVIAVKDREIRDLKRKLEKQSEALKQVEHNTHASSQKSVGSEVKQQPEEQRHRRFQVNSTDKENIPFGM